MLIRAYEAMVLSFDWLDFRQKFTFYIPSPSN